MDEFHFGNLKIEEKVEKKAKMSGDSLEVLH